MPFWKGESIGRPAGAGAGGRCVRAGDGGAGRRGRPRRVPPRPAWTSGPPTTCSPTCASSARPPGTCPSDRTILVERFRDELGDWRLVVHSPFGAQVNGPWALAIAARMRERRGVEVHASGADDGIVLRLPDAVDDTGAEVVPTAEDVLLDPGEVEQIVVAELGGSSLFASRFRECAARALLLPRRDPKRRSPLWQQRQKSRAAAGRGRQVRAVPGDAGGDARVRAGRLRPARAARADERRRGPEGAGRRGRDAHRRRRSPAACSSATSGCSSTRPTPRWPSAGPRRCRWTRRCSRSCSARRRSASCSTRRCVTEVEESLQRLAPDRHARDAEGAADLLRFLGPLSTAEAAARGVAPEWLAELEAARRAIRVRIAGERALAGGRGRRPGARRARRAAAGRGAGDLHRAGAGPAGRPAAAARPHARPLPRGRGRGPVRARGGGGVRRAGPAGRHRPARPGRAAARRARVDGVGGTARAPSTATPRCCAGCDGRRWPGCGRRWSRSSRGRWAGSCRRGRACRSPPAAGGGGCAGRRARTTSSAWSSSSRGRRCRRARWSRWCCRLACRATPPPCWTS